MKKELVWHKVLDNPDNLPEGRVMTVSAAHKPFCLMWETKLINPSFAEFARSCGALGFKVEKKKL